MSTQSSAQLPDVERRCKSCGNVFATKQVRMYRFTFPADRFCRFCREAEEAERHQKKAEILLSQASIPVEYAHCSFDNFEPVPGTDTARSWAKRWADDLQHDRRPRKGLLLHGPPGSGKTHLAVAIIRHAIHSEHFRRCLFLNVPEWLNLLRELSISRDAGAGDPPNPAAHEIVVVDDLGAENSTPWTRERIYSLVNDQVQNRRLTIVTTNLAPGEVAARLGRPTASRLTRLCHEVRLDPPQDYRERAEP